MDEDDLLMQEVEEEISRIHNKYKGNNAKENNFCNESNIESCIRYLAEELECFDICHINNDPVNSLNDVSSLKNIIIQLINSNYDLLKRHREVFNKQNESLENNARVLSDVNHLSKTVEMLRKELNTKENQLKVNKEKILLNKMESNELQSKIHQAKKEMNVIQKGNAFEVQRHKHELQKVLSNSKKLEDRFRKNCGTYVSRDSHTITIIDNYKKNEEKYKDLIEQLQKNNQELIEELLQHKENNIPIK